MTSAERHINYRRYYPILHIPEGKAGRFAIAHIHKPAGHIMKLATVRTAFNGQKPPSQIDVYFPMATVWHSLLENGGTWMTDIPLEQYQHNVLLRPFAGRVLVGGLGLGYAVTRLAASDRVTEIVVVEKSKSVINLVWPYLANAVHRKATVIHDDLFKFLGKPVTRPYDFGFYDIWQSDSEATFHHTVVPLRRLSRGKVKRVACWNEDIMRGQLLRGMQSRLMMLANPEIVPNGMDLPGILLSDKSIYFRWARPFWTAVLDAPDGRTWPNPHWSAKAERYVRMYGMRDDL